eukprot:Skav228940  [mRNA]  locus=scaffold2181:359534:359893:- [translate_table: standard]
MAALENPDSLHNYKSVEEATEDAEIELRRYEQANYLQRMPREQALEKFPGGTVSRLGLVLKTKDTGEIKRRIVIDLRRSGGNAKSVLPEKLILPRVVDVIHMLKELRASKVLFAPQGEG